MLKKNFKSLVIVLISTILASIAIFTSIRLYQLRKESVSPAAPESKPRAETICRADIMLILDASGSMERKGPDGIEKIIREREAANTFIDRIIEIKQNNPVQNQIRVGLASFGMAPQPGYRIINPLSEDLMGVKSKISEVQHTLDLGTPLEGGLKVANDEHLAKPEEVSQISLLVSDGCANRNLSGQRIPYDQGQAGAIIEANRGRAGGISFYVVGYDSNTQTYDCEFDEATLRGIANDPDSTYYLFRPDPAQWAATFENIAHQICQIITTPSPTLTPIPTVVPTPPPACQPLFFKLIPTLPPTSTPTLPPTSTPTLPPTSTPTSTSVSTSSPTPIGRMTQTVTLSPTQKAIKEEPLPQAGTSNPTIIGVGISILLLIVSITLVI